MAGILLQSGDHRWIGRQSYLMIHEISAGAGGKIGELKDSVEFFDAICKRVVSIFVDRSEGKCTKARFVKGWTRTDWWLMSEDAHKLGFVDEIR
jgi:ATP-dependent protease ClpP protease subunit